MSEDIGIYVVGKLAGYSESTWTKGSQSGTNRRVGIVTGEYQDEFGQVVQDTTSIDVMPNQADQIRTFCDQNKGKRVTVKVVFRARVGGKNGAWLSAFMPKDSQIDLAEIPRAKA